jgi:hypothetical protein
MQTITSLLPVPLDEDSESSKLILSFRWLSVSYRATAKLAGRIASSRSVPERAGRCLIRMLPALQCFVKRRTVGMRDCGCW